MNKNLIRYKVMPAKVAENEAFVRAVYIQLREQPIDGFHYATFQLEDGVSFIHLAFADSEEANNAFTNLSAFKNFRANLQDRLDESPVVTPLDEIGSYNFIESI